MPAPRTIAATRDDVLSNYAFFFGDPVVPERLRDYTEQHAMTFHFPDAYYGQNTKIRETLNNLILKEPQEWHTQVALPFVKIVGTSVEWDEIKFDVRLLQRVPYEGISRMSTSLRRRHRDRVVRRGIGLTIESDFYATEAGRAHFADQLKSIRYCVQETCNFDVIFAYLTCTNYDFRYDIQRGLRPRRSVRQAMAHEINMYAVVQKEQTGLDKAVETVKFRMSRYSVTPNIMIIPPQLGLYLSLAPESKLTFPLGGPAAAAAFEQGLAGFEARSFRGLGIMTSTPYEVSDDQDSVQMLQRSTQIGEYYRMAPPNVFASNQKLPASYMDIMVYDEEQDMHVMLPFAEALHATCYCHAEAADLRNKDVFGMKSLSNAAITKMLEHGSAIGGKAKERAKMLAQIFRLCGATYVAGMEDEEPSASGGDDGPPPSNRETSGSKDKPMPAEGIAESTAEALGQLEGAIGAARAEAAARVAVPVSTQINDAEIDAAMKNLASISPQTQNEFRKKEEVAKALVAAILETVAAGVWVPIEIVIARPFIQHLMLSAIVAVAGSTTGATLFGPADMQLSANTSVKTIEGHYTCHTKATIYKPENVCVMRDVMCNGYVAGGNTRYFGQALGQSITATLDPERLRENMEERLALHDDAAGEYCSLLAFACPYNNMAKRDQVISITRRLLPWEVTNPNGRKDYFPGGHSSFEAYERLYGLDTVHFGEDVRAAENMEFISNGSMNNAMCFIGPHRRYNPFSNQYHQLVPGQGHFGPDALPGVSPEHKHISTPLSLRLFVLLFFPHTILTALLVAGRPLASRRDGVAEVVARCDGLDRSERARADDYDQGAS